MTKQEILESLKTVGKDIKTFLGFSEEAAAGDTVPATNGKEYATDSGAVITIDKLEAGGVAMTAEGSPMGPGAVTLADGTIVTIGEGGAIVSVEVMQPEEMAAPDPKDEEIAQLKAQLQAMQTSTAQFSEQAKAAETRANAAITAVEKLTGVMLEFAAEPSADPIQAPSDKAPAPPRKNIVQIARENKAMKNS